MSNLISALPLCVAAAFLSAPMHANAAPTAVVACTVAVDYVHDGTVAESYRKDFVAEQGVGFVDDFSTPTRQKRFTASVAKDGGDAVVSIDYFSDVGVFHAIGFNARMTIHGGGGIESTSGSNGFFASSGVSPASVAGNHQTSYQLVCRRT